MPSYPELGRHTPPPPPYSSNQRNCGNDTTTLEASQRSDPPPPPPPTSYRTPEKQFSVPSTCEFEKTVASSHSYLGHNDVALPTPTVLFQDAATQSLNAGQPIEDHGRNQYRDSIRFGLPVEPKLASGSHGHPLRHFDGSLLECGSEPLPHHGTVYAHDLGTRPEYDAFTSQSTRTVSSIQGLPFDATQTPLYGVAVDDWQPMPICRRYSSTIVPPVAYSNGPNAATPVGPLGTVYPPSTRLSQWAVAGPPTLTTTSTATIAPSLHHSAPPAQLTKHHMSQGHDQWRRFSRFNQRRSSVSVRYEPYKRRQSSIAPENAEQLRLAGEADKELVKEMEEGSDIGKEGRGKEGQGEHKD